MPRLSAARAEAVDFGCCTKAVTKWQSGSGLLDKGDVVRPDAFYASLRNISPPGQLARAPAAPGAPASDVSAVTLWYPSP
jgi:hypothetical protein